MIKYIKITKYMAGDSIDKQIQDIIDAGMMKIQDCSLRKIIV